MQVVALALMHVLFGPIPAGRLGLSLNSSRANPSMGLVRNARVSLV